IPESKSPSPHSASCWPVAPSSDRRCRRRSNSPNRRRICAPAAKAIASPSVGASPPAPPVVPKQPKAPRGTAQKPASPPAPQTYTDTLPAAMQQQDPAAEVTYAVEVLNRNARGAGLSNRVHVPALVTEPPPADLSAELTGDGVVLTWTSAGESQRVPASPPGVQLRYRIYRRQEGLGDEG